MYGFISLMMVPLSSGRRVPADSYVMKRRKTVLREAVKVVVVTLADMS